MPRINLLVLHVMAIFFLLTVSNISAQTDRYEFTQAVFSNSGDLIALSSRFALWIYDDQLLPIQQLELLPANAIGANTSTPQVVRVEWSADDSTLAASISFVGTLNGIDGVHNYVRVWDTQTWQLLSSVSNLATTRVYDLNQDGSQVVAISGTTDIGPSTTDIFDTTSGDTIYALDVQGEWIEWNPLNADEIIVGVKNIQIWNMQNDALVREFGSFFTDRGMKVNQINGLLAVANLDWDIDIWYTTTGQLLQTIDDDGPINRYLWAGDDIVTENFDGIWRRWNIVTGKSRILPINTRSSWSPDDSKYIQFDEGVLVLTDALTHESSARLMAGIVSQTVSFSVVDSNTNEKIPNYAPIINNTIIDLAQIVSNRLMIRANIVQQTVSSVIFDLNGTQTIVNAVPYTIPIPPAGTYSLTATPYTEADGGGSAGAPLTIEFTVSEP